MRAVPAAICVLVALLLGYAGAYYGLLVPADAARAVMPKVGSTLYYREPKYVLGGEYIQTFFGPIQRLDALTRPDSWWVFEVFDPEVLLERPGPDSPGDYPTLKW